MGLRLVLFIGKRGVPRPNSFAAWLPPRPCHWASRARPTFLLWSNFDPSISYSTEARLSRRPKKKFTFS